MRDRQIVPLSRALIWILLSTVVISGSATLAWLYALRLEARRVHDPSYTITEILQRPSSSEGLPSSYLAEILELSTDTPINSYRLNPANANLKLRKHPLIQTARVKKLLPHTLIVDYKLREPIAILSDWSNTAIDREGQLFPLEPFYDEEGLPELYLGIGKRGLDPWGKRVAGPEWDLALEILDTTPDFSRLDLSQAYADSFGRREVVVQREDVILRLNTRQWRENLQQFEQLEPMLEEVASSPRAIVDLRIPQIAFVKGRR